VVLDNATFSQKEKDKEKPAGRSNINSNNGSTVDKRRSSVLDLLN